QRERMEDERGRHEERLGEAHIDEQEGGGRELACGKRVHFMIGVFIRARFLHLFPNIQKHQVINIRWSDGMTQKNNGLPNDTVSYWQDSVELPEFPALKEDLDVHVCIVGAGITGIITAY